MIEVKRGEFWSHYKHIHSLQFKVNEKMLCYPVHLNSLDLTELSPLKLYFRDHWPPKHHVLSTVWVLMSSGECVFSAVPGTTSALLCDHPQGFVLHSSFSVLYIGKSNRRNSTPLWETCIVYQLAFPITNIRHCVFILLIKFIVYLIKNPNQLFQNFSSIHLQPREPTI